MNTRMILIALLLVLALPVSAAERVYSSVEEIVKETRFWITDLETYKREIKTGKVVGFYFSEVLGADETNGLLAKVFKETMEPFTRILFIALRDDPNVLDQNYIDLGFTGVPAYAFYVNGNRIFLKNAGPANAQEYERSIQIFRKNLKLLKEMK